MELKKNVVEYIYWFLIYFGFMLLKQIKFKFT